MRKLLDLSRCIHRQGAKFIQLQPIRTISTNDVITTRLADWVDLKQDKRVDPAQNDERPLVIIYKWLRSRSKDVWKFEELYLDRGFDVLTTGVAVAEILYRPFIIRRTDDVIAAVNRPELRRRKIVIHTFSAGSYLLGELRHRLLSDRVAAPLGAEVSDRIVAHVGDSFVDDGGCSYGITRMIFGDNFVADGVLAAMNASDAVLSKVPFTCVYAVKKVYGALHENPFRCPVLLLYSSIDSLGAPQWSELTAERWRKLGIPVREKCWPDSPHVGHFRKYREEYVELLDSFLLDVGLLGGRSSGDDVIRAGEPK